MRIAIGSDHAGYALKEAIKSFLPEMGSEVVDCGAGSEASVDYPDFGFAVADAVSMAQCDRGILICKSGIGMSVVANKVLGIRAALCYDVEAARLSRAHNDANVLVMGAAWMDPDRAREMVGVWLETAFEGGRHLKRLEKIMDFERDRSSIKD
ncbi:MAG: ribose 5-phosphate isomerase B [Candidatus Eisenbacteria sp.]|nr:ribose 5-phosphate isomerase B [Candidatus Eisenbacteria bacterium]